MDPRMVIFAFGAGSGMLLGFVAGCFATWAWVRFSGLLRDEAEWERARAARRAESDHEPGDPP